MAEAKYPSGRAISTVKYVRSNFLTFLTILAIVLGISFGCVLRSAKEDKWSQREQTYVKFGGEVFLRMLKALTLPLIISSVIAALGSLELRLAGKIGFRTGLFYFTTTICAVLLGMILVVAIRPGTGINDNGKDKLELPIKIKPREILNSDVMMDIVRNMFPSNLFHATMHQYETIMDMSTLEGMKGKLPANESIDTSTIPTKSRPTEGSNILGLIVFSTIFGLALASLGPYGKAVLKFFRCFSQIMMIISNWVLWLAPAGIFCLLAGKILEIGDLHDTFHLMKMFVFTVIFGLLTHGLVVLPIIYFVVSATHPFTVMGNVIHALVTAFGTSSSTATLPATVACVEDKNGVDPRIARFMLPIGSVMNMDGTALYQAVAAVFLAQVYGASLDLGSVLAISVVAVITSIGVAGIPHAGIVIVTMMTNILGLPAESVAFLIPVDFVLDRCRTTLNVLGDTLGASLVDKLCKEELAKLPTENIISSKEPSLSTLVEDV